MTKQVFDTAHVGGVVDYSVIEHRPAKSSKVAKCPEPRLPWELEIANSLVTK